MPNSLLRLTWNDPATGEPQESSFTLPVTIGRERDNGLVLNSNQVSRHHAHLVQEGKQIVIIDQNSTNGVQVNQQRIQRAALENGDVVQIGNFRLIVWLALEAPPAGHWLLRWSDPQTGQAQEMVINAPLTIGRLPDNKLVLSQGNISRQHARIVQEGADLVIIDQNSANGILVNGQKQSKATLRPGDIITISVYRFSLVAPDQTASSNEFGATVVMDNKATLVFDHETGQLTPVLQSTDAQIEIFKGEKISVEMLRRLGFPLDETTYLAIGGGIGSFVWVDHLRIFGVRPEQIVAIGLENKPYGRYERLCRHSQIPQPERLRSNSDSCPDNIWGWPGYAVREMWASLKRAELGNLLRVGWQIFNEPTLIQTYTPRSGDVYRSIDQEAQRIGWDKIWRFGHVKLIRKTDDGRYVVLYSQSSKEKGQQLRLMLAHYVHIAVGYPGVRLLPDLQNYRMETDDFQHVVNAYEMHDHVYDYLEKNGGIAMLRGRGIVASRILQRLHEAHQKNPKIAVLHLLRSPLTRGNRSGRSQRLVKNHWELQPFNWPKACWGGEYRFMLEKANDETRSQLLNDWGGTTTADRTDWQQIIKQGLDNGWYQIRFGDVAQVQKGSNNKLVTEIHGKGVLNEQLRLEADFIIDCTGLEAAVDSNPLLKELIDHYSLPKNVKGRLKVDNHFEMAGMQNGNGRLFAAGAMTLGGPVAPVDSFLGLQLAALIAVDALVAAKAPGLRRLNGLRSMNQWLRWARGVEP